MRNEQQTEGDSQRGDARAILDRSIPFRFLSTAQKERLTDELQLATFSPGDVIIEQGGQDRSVYILARGEVEVFDPAHGGRRVNVIHPDHYFGEWEPLFDVDRIYSIRATQQATCVFLSGDRFMELVHDSRPFALSLSVILRDQQGIFAAFDRFKVELMRSLGSGSLSIQKLLPLYRALDPALHRLANSEEIDADALSYVVRRLPVNVTSTFAYLLTDEIPAVYREPDALFEQVPTDARRRDIWELLPGSDLVLLRNGISDLVDFVSCLCVYAVEAAKIRSRVNDASVVAFQRERPTLDPIPLSRTEREGLVSIWGDDAPRRVLDIVTHGETFSVSIRRHSEKYNSRRTELWTKQLAAACRELLGVDPGGLPREFPVHIVSSNTHSVTNCLTSWYIDHKDDIDRWVAETRHPLGEREWHNQFDRVYSVARDYFVAHPEAARDASAAEERQGIVRLHETASTGIQVQLIDTDRVCRSLVDPSVASCATGEPGLIVNIDYAFGEQAEHILRNLVLLFGRNVRSVSLFGKAGALVGQRGDVLVPTAFLEQSGDRYYAMPAVTGIPAGDGGDGGDAGDAGDGGETGSAAKAGSAVGGGLDSLRAMLPGGEIHAGPMLTVDGTLLQNRDMLRFYRHIWRCIGMEMEGAYYYRQFLEGRSTGLIGSDTSFGVYYYVSDVPLQHGTDLATRLDPSEGIPPLYAITRHILSQVFGGAP